MGQYHADFRHHSSHEINAGENLLRHNGPDLADYDVAGFFNNHLKLIIGSAQVIARRVP